MTKRYRLVESNVPSIPPEIGNKRIDIDWSSIEQTVGSKISSDVRSKYEHVCSGKSFKIFTFLMLFSRFGNVVHLWFITKSILGGTITNWNFAIWVGVAAAQCVSYLYNWWFVGKNNLYNIDKETGEEIVYENDQPKVNVSATKSKLSKLWTAVKESDSKWKWILIVILIMIAGLLVKYTSGTVVENQYKQQYKRIKKLSEQDNGSSSGGLTNLPDVEKLVNMNPEESQKIAQDFIEANNLTNNKQFAKAFKAAVNEDKNRNNNIIQKVKTENPVEFSKIAQQTRDTKGQSFFDSATSNYKNSLTPGSLLINVAFSIGIGIFSGPMAALNNLLIYTFPNILVSGFGTFTGIAFMIVQMISQKAAAGSRLAHLAGGIKQLMILLGIGLACACAIRWIFNFLLNPKKNSKKPIVNKSGLSKELGTDVIEKNIQNSNNQSQQTESYIYTNTIYLNEGVINFIKTKIVNFFKGTWKCLKAVVSHPGIGMGFKVVITILAIGFVLAAGYFGVKAVASGGIG